MLDGGRPSIAHDVFWVAKGFYGLACGPLLFGEISEILHGSYHGGCGLGVVTYIVAGFVVA